MQTAKQSPNACPCSARDLPADEPEQVQAFYDLRINCPALKLMIPDQIVEDHRRFTAADPDKAHHASIPFLAYRRGHLGKLTECMHRFAISGNELRRDVTEQYKSDLRETWVLKAEEILRYRAARLFESRVAELQFAQWIESQRWTISNLELYGGQFDVEGIDPNGEETSFEIKFLAQREVLFECNMASFVRPQAASLGVYSPVDYLLFRLYEAARQLVDTPKHRIAVAVITDYEISYEIPLSEGWIDWGNPVFLRRDPEIQGFLDGQYRGNPNLDVDVKAAIVDINEIWILRFKHGFELQLEHRIQVPKR